MNQNSNHISNNPISRLTPEMVKLLEQSNVKFDCHTHIFDFDHVPNSYFGIRLPMSKKVLTKAKDFLQNLLKSDDNITDHVANFIEILNKNSMQEIAETLFSLYPEDKYIFCVLLMDMEFGIEKPEKDYENQIEEIVKIRNLYPDKILPFFAVDPRRENIYSRFLQAFSQPENFFGVKIYPALGYIPSDPILMEIFKVCEEKQIPVITHCGGYAVHSSKDDIQVQGLRKNESGTFEAFSEIVNFSLPKSIGEYFNSPSNWEPVLYQFPKLKLNLAHFGGSGEWGDYINERTENKRKTNSWVSQIIEMMYVYENVYTDFGYAMAHPFFFSTLKNLINDNQRIAERMLFGTDFYMTTMEGIFKSIKRDFITGMGDKIMKQISQTNPKRFLFNIEN